MAIIETLLLMLSGLIGSLLGTIPKSIYAEVIWKYPALLTLSVVFGFLASIISLILPIYIYGFWHGIGLWVLIGLLVTFLLKGIIIRNNGLFALVQVPTTLALFVYLSIKYL